MSETNEREDKPRGSGSELSGLVMCWCEKQCFPEHCTDSDSCWCEPEHAYVDGNKIIIHRGAH